MNSTVKTISVRYLCPCGAHREKFNVTRDLSKAGASDDVVTATCEACGKTHAGPIKDVYETMKKLYLAQMYGKMNSDQYEFSFKDIARAKTTPTTANLLVELDARCEDLLRAIAADNKLEMQAMHRHITKVMELFEKEFNLDE